MAKLEQFLADHLLLMGAVGIGVACLQVSEIGDGFSQLRPRTQVCGMCPMCTAQPAGLVNTHARVCAHLCAFKLPVHLCVHVPAIIACVFVYASGKVHPVSLRAGKATLCPRCLPLHAPPLASIQEGASVPSFATIKGRRGRSQEGILRA